MPRKLKPAKRQKRQEDSSFLTRNFLERQKFFLEKKLDDCRKLQKSARQGINIPFPDERKGDVPEQAFTYSERQIAARQLEECGKVASQVIWALQLVNNLLAGKKSKKGEEEYGKCVGYRDKRCQGRIPEKRLTAIPWARRCVSCQEREDAKSRK